MTEQVDQLAAIIRHVDGGNRLGAAALAEAILSHPDIGLVLANSDGPDWPARLRNCPTHGQQPPQAWGCPECVRQLREELAAARLHQPATPLEVKGASDEELESVARAAEIQDMREQGGLTASDANGIQAQLQRQRLAGLRAVFNLDRQPTPPAEGEVAPALARLEFAVETYTGWDDSSIEDAVRDLRTLLQQQEAEINRLRAQQAPVPVIERLPGWEDCDEEGRCWWGATALSDGFRGNIPHSWRLCQPEDRFGSELFWCPAHALPMPQGEVEK